MINNITVTGPHLYSSTSESGMPYISPNDSVPMMGMVRCINQRFEIWNGAGWVSTYGSNAQIAMTVSASNAIEWALKKMEDEKRLEKLVKENKTIADAAEAVKRAQEQLEIVLALTDKEIS